jgi:hypothetical protein
MGDETTLRRIDVVSGATASGGDSRFLILSAFHAFGTPTSPRVSRRVPPATSAAQAYFWTRKWQAREEAAAADLAAGRFREFDDPDAAVHYLLRSDED